MTTFHPTGSGTSSAVVIPFPMATTLRARVTRAVIDAYPCRFADLEAMLDKLNSAEVAEMLRSNTALVEEVAGLATRLRPRFVLAGEFARLATRLVRAEATIVEAANRAFAGEVVS